MTLHLFDKPEPGPSLDELLEGFWGGKDQTPWQHEAESPTVWALEIVYLAEKGDDAFFYKVFHCKEAALWDHWFEHLDEVYDYKDEQPDFDATQWLADTLTELQNLRDDGQHHDFDVVYNLKEVSVG